MLLLTKVPRMSPDSAVSRRRVWGVVGKLPWPRRCGSAGEATEGEDSRGEGGRQEKGRRVGAPGTEQLAALPSFPQQKLGCLGSALVFKLCGPAGTAARPEHHLRGGGCRGEDARLLSNHHQAGPPCSAGSCLYRSRQIRYPPPLLSSVSRSFKITFISQGQGKRKAGHGAENTPSPQPGVYFRIWLVLGFAAALCGRNFYL